MSISKLKIALVTTAVGFVGFATPAYAQISVEDRDANGHLHNIEEDAKSEYDSFKEFRDNNITDHYEDQIEHYDREIARLNAMITSLGYYRVEGEDAPTQKDGLDTAFDDLDPTTDAREAVQAAAVGNSNEFGIVIDGFEESALDSIGLGGLGEGDGPSAFRAEFGLAAPGRIFPGNEQLAKNMSRLYSSVYLAQTVAGEANLGREARLEAYSNLREKAQSSTDLQTALRVQNAILLENGRNLALLIDLQTAQLNTQSIGATQAATETNRPSTMFGGGSETLLGAAANAAMMTALVEAVN